MPAASSCKPYSILRTRRDFLAAREGMRVSGETVRLEVFKRPGDSQPAGPRVGFTVTKKNGNAVVRNRIKRRLREAVRLHAARDMRPGHDYVIISKPDVLTTGFAALCEDVIRTIGRAHARADRDASNAS